MTEAHADRGMGLKVRGEVLDVRIQQPQSADTPDLELQWSLALL